jgi:uncharacterized protein YndB with AHSA1/START domain
MEKEQRTILKVFTTVKAPVEVAWKCWTTPQDIVRWNNASEDWLTSTAKNDFRPGGKFNYRIEAKDGSFGFNFEGTYLEIVTHESIKYVIADNRKVEVLFFGSGKETQIAEYFEAEDFHPAEMQSSGWQAILNNFKKYTEAKNRISEEF